MMHTINILLNPHDGGSRIAVQMLDGDLGKMNALHGPGVIFAQVFPQMGENGKALGIKMKAITLDHKSGLEIKAILRSAQDRVKKMKITGLCDDTFHGGIPAHLARPDVCSYRDDNHRCNHAMNPTRMCGDDRYCMVAVFREQAGESDIHPCGLLTGKACAGHKNHDALFAGCGSDWCIHHRPGAAL